jgi:hypothetical protein
MQAPGARSFSELIKIDWLVNVAVNAAVIRSVISHSSWDEVRHAQQENE